MDYSNIFSEKLQYLNNTNSLGIFPSFFLKGLELNEYNEKQKLNYTWEKEGLNLLSKIYFSTEDIKIYKSLLIKNCIPLKYKGEFWYISTGAKQEHFDNPNYYKILLNNYPKEVSLPMKKQIELDIKRTFPEDEYYQNNENLNKLRNVLLTYSKRNLSIGYVQGFNFIVGRLLKYLNGDEEKTFWIFVKIIENILSIDYYSEMAGVMSDVDILLCLMKHEYLKDLINNLDEYFFIYLKNIIMQWFLSLFILNFPEKSQLIVWDFFFIEHIIVFFKLSIYLINLVKEKLLEFKGLEEFKNFLKDYFENFNRNDEMIYDLMMKKYKFDSEFIEINRKDILNIYIQNINSNNKFKKDILINKTKERTDYCDIMWPYCIYECESYYKIIDHLVLRPALPLNIIENYMEKDFDENDDNLVLIRDNNIDIDYENILIERKQHVCSELKRAKIQSENYKNSSESFISTGTEKSENEQINDYYIRKSKYKKLRKLKCVSSLEKIQNEKNIYNFDVFLQKFNNKYNKMSQMNSIVLKHSYDKDNNNNQGIDLNFYY